MSRNNKNFKKLVRRQQASGTRAERQGRTYTPKPNKDFRKFEFGKDK